jgi:hypothetical protein
MVPGSDRGKARLLVNNLAPTLRRPFSSFPHAPHSLIPGHMSVRDITSDWEEVIHVIRLKHPHTPVFVFGGHNHIRDCKKPDAHSIIMASGRYMETVGWVS